MKINNNKLIQLKTMKRKLFWCMTALTALVVTSCSSELALEGVPNNGVDGEEVEVTFSVSAMNSHAVMRADNDQLKGPGFWQRSVGKGRNIDMLIYAVYEKEGDEYTLLTQYGSEIPSVFSDSKALTMKDGNGENYKHEGQTILDVSQTLQKGESETITLRLMRNKQYHIAFWAQSSETTAFNTDDLEKVQVIYKDASEEVQATKDSLNNDELRDAFCKVESFTVSAEAPTRDVILTRPMAQINMGTTGADYNFVMKEKLRTFTQSRIRLYGVAQYLNVVTDEVDDSQLKDSVDFGFNVIPAYINRKANKEEEFLVVDLDNDGITDGDNDIYREKYPTLDEDGSFLTETFKYLSMCYVLVPASVKEGDIPKDQQEYTSSVLKGIKVWLAQTKIGENNVLYGMEAEYDNARVADPYKSIDLQFVPVHRNWRTNILCGLYKGIPDENDPKDPNDPDDPNGPDDPSDDDDDPTSIYKTPYVLVHLDADYYGEWSNPNAGAEDDWKQSSFGTSGN